MQGTRDTYSPLAASNSQKRGYTIGVEHGDARGTFWLSTVAALSVAAALSVVAWKLSYIEPVQIQVMPVRTTVVPQASLSTADATDSDNDSVPDWQELLLGTDPRSADSRPTSTPALQVGTSTTDISPLAHATEALAGSIITGYLNLTQNGDYTATRGEALGQTLAQNLYATIPYAKHDPADVKVDTDTSSERVAQYRKDMQTALAPLTKNTDAPFALLARYYVRGDASAFDALSASAERYRQAEALAARVVVPRDGTVVHTQLLDALDYSANTIDAMARYARDPAAAAQLLKTYNDVEQAVVHAFDALDAYYLQKDVHV